MKTLSIIIPCFNAAKTILNTIDSFNLEELSNEIDVLVIDDGSTDNIEEILTPHMNQYPDAIHYHKKANGNYGSVINYAKHLLNSRFVKTCDADDTYTKENMVKFINHLKDFPEDTDIVFTNFAFININSGQKTKNSLTNQFLWTQTPTIYSIDELAKNKIGYPTIHGMTFKSELFASIADSPEHIFYTDSLTIYLCLKQAKKIAYIPHLYIYNYYVLNEEQSINISNIAKRKNQIIQVLNAILNDSDFKGLSKKHKTWLFSVMRMVIKFVFLSITFGDQDDETKNKEIEEVTNLVLQHVHKNDELKAILDLQLTFMFKVHPKKVVRIIKNCYGLAIGKFARSTRNSKKKDKKRQELAHDFYNPSV